MDFFYHLIISTLSCNITFTNPNLVIEIKTCRSNLKKITFKFGDITIFDTFFGNNQNAIKSLYNLFRDQYHDCSVKIELIDLTSKSNYVKIPIDNQWISNIIQENDVIIHNINLYISIIDNSWTKMNLTINKDINTLLNYNSLHFYLYDYGTNSSCTITISVMDRIENQLSDRCTEFVTIIENSKLIY